MVSVSLGFEFVCFVLNLTAQRFTVIRNDYGEMVSVSLCSGASAVAPES